MTMAISNLLGTCFVQIHCVQINLRAQKTFQSLGRGDYQCLHCTTTFQVRKMFCGEQRKLFSFRFCQGVSFFEKTQKSIEDVIGDVYRPTEKYVYLSTNKKSNFYNCKKCKTCSNVLMIPFKAQKLTINFFGGDGTQCLAKKTSRVNEKEKPSTFRTIFSNNHNEAHRNLSGKRQKLLHFWHNRVDSPLDDAVTQTIFSILNSYTFSLQ